MFVAKKVIVFIALLLLVISIVFVGSCATNDPLDLMYVQDLYTYDTGTATWVKLPGAGGLPAQAGHGGKFLTTDGAAASWAVNGNGDMLKTTYDTDADNLVDVAEVADIANGLWEYHLVEPNTLAAPTLIAETFVELVSDDNESFTTAAAANIRVVPTGDILCHVEAMKTAGGASVTLYFELYELTSGAVENLIAYSPNTSELPLSKRVGIDMVGQVSVPFTMAADSNLKLYIYSVKGIGGAPTVRLYYEGATESRVVAVGGRGGFDSEKVTDTIGNTFADSTTVDFTYTDTDNSMTADVTSSVVVESDVDDTPVNGATTDPISSNWAFDHNADVTTKHLPDQTGNNGKYLTTNGAVASWASVSTTPTSIQDADADTKIQTEEAADEDKIRFDTGGTERLVLDSTGLDFKTLKAIAMAADNGATVPASPAVGQWFLHTPTGRSILMQYSGSAWIPIISMGTMTVYVDKTDGTDGAAYGTGVDGNAFKTIQYAFDSIPPLYAGNIVVNVNGETYAEDLVLRGKFPTGNYGITLQGVLTEHLSATQDSSVQGATTTYGSITDVGQFTGHANDLLWSSNNAEYRVIDTATDDTATIVGYWSAAPSGTYKIYQWATQIRGIHVDLYAGTFTANDIYFNQTSSGFAWWMTGSMNSYAYRCKFGSSVVVLTVVGNKGGMGFYESLFLSSTVYYAVYTVNNSSFGLEYSKAAISFNSADIFWLDQMSMLYLNGAIVIDGDAGGGNKASSGVNARANSVVSLGALYNKIRNCDIGVYATFGATVFNTGNNQYSGNTANETAVAASYAYID